MAMLLWPPLISSLAPALALASVPASIPIVALATPPSVVCDEFILMSFNAGSIKFLALSPSTREKREE